MPTQSLLGNGNLTVAMRQQDANRTRQWIEDTVDKTYITQTTSYEGDRTGEYAESRSAESHKISKSVCACDFSRSDMHRRAR